LPSLYEHAGGEEALHQLEDSFYSSVLSDPLFGAGKPEHVDHLTAFTAESFGGPDGGLPSRRCSACRGPGSVHQ